VDWLSLDGYNIQGGQAWYQPYEVFDGNHPPSFFFLFNYLYLLLYSFIAMLYKLRDWRPNLPVMISEVGSYSDGGTRVADKAAWISALIPYFAKWSIPKTNNI
jgi:hypothetical protein